MMIMTKYKKLYIAEDSELVTDYIIDNYMVWCSKHWEWFYERKGRTCEFETLEDYSLVFCESDEEFEEIDKKIDPKHPDVFDYSFEFDYPSLLIKTEYLELCLK